MNVNNYGGTIGMMASNDNLKTNQIASYNGDEVDFTSNRARVMSEIIV